MKENIIESFINQVGYKEFVVQLIMLELLCGRDYAEDIYYKYLENDSCTKVFDLHLVLSDENY